MSAEEDTAAMAVDGSVEKPDDDGPSPMESDTLPEPLGCSSSSAAAEEAEEGSSSNDRDVDMASPEGGTDGADENRNGNDMEKPNTTSESAGAPKPDAPLGS
eukprot:RCo028439